MTLKVKAEAALNIDVRRHVIMIFKEAMHNSLKYSEASTSYFKLDQQGGFVEFSFRDNGKGLDEHRVVSGYGLKNMISRSEEIDGQLKIDSNENGTSIKLLLKIEELPIEKNIKSSIILP
ncbi:MAG: signal transduction histidine kinase [Saprospiraceae bacterium]|jgi:signal transduction histidine kinase